MAATKSKRPAEVLTAAEVRSLSPRAPAGHLPASATGRCSPCSTGPASVSRRR